MDKFKFVRFASKLKFSHLKRASLIPFFALIGLGSDGLSSSCYGPQEAYLALGKYSNLIIIIALLSMLTITVITISYTQIIELFSHGGGGYLVASKLLSPKVGLISGCALLVDYVLTTTISIASGVDAILSLMPNLQHDWRFTIKLSSIVIFTLINLRGVRESVWPLMPIFVLFLATHFFAFGWSFFYHSAALPDVFYGTVLDVHEAHSEFGMYGLLFLLLRSFSMGAGTFTGIEAVSNGMSLIREPKVPNAKKTMAYMATFLSLTVFGLVVSFLLYQVKPEHGQTVNALLLGNVGREIGGVIGPFFQPTALFAEAALLFIAAETGFLGGPQVLSNMALDRWFPHKFASLSDRLVIRNGIFLMGFAATAIMIYTKGSVDTLIILYSVSVFITFTLSQLGMVRHWWTVRGQEKHWIKKLFINGTGCLLSMLILVAIVSIKFIDGAWLTLLIVFSLVMIGLFIRRYYNKFIGMVTRLPCIIPTLKTPMSESNPSGNSRTAILLIGTQNWLAKQLISNILKIFGNTFEHYVFVYVGIVDAGSFKGKEEIKGLERFLEDESENIVNMMREKGYNAEGIISIGVDIPDVVEKQAIELSKKYHNSAFFGSKLILPKDTILSRWLSNHTLYAVQRRFYSLKYPFMAVPIFIRNPEKNL